MAVTVYAVKKLPLMSRKTYSGNLLQRKTWCRLEVMKMKIDRAKKHVNHALNQLMEALDAGKSEKLIRETTPFGTWSLPVGFKKTPDGGSCGPGCHKPFTYNREIKTKPVNKRINQ